MLCQFCGFDNSETGLSEGRCHRCGSRLAWNDSSGDVTPEVQAAVAQLAARIAPLEGGGNLADSGDFQAVAAALRGKGAAPARPADTPTEPRMVGAGTPVDAPALEAHWRQGIDTEAHPLRTLKGVSTSSVSDLPVFIHPRAVRRPGDPEFGPSEYELLDVIGEGGVGIVYSARQSSIDRNVAVKMIRTVHESDQTTRDKFLAEAIVTGDLDHPNIVPVYDLGKDASGAFFYSMKRVVGTPWSAALLRKSQAENLDILMKVADAIAFAHARGVVHRDIKPENVMLGEFGEVLVMDWGIALPLASYRKTGGVLASQGLGGTPAYMAPEMATGPLSKISTASDVYLLGAVLYEIVTGSPPHRGADVMSCVLAAAKNEIMPTDKGGELIDIALRAMAKKPEDRYATVQDFQKDVRAYQSHVESVVLGERADRQLDEARRTGSYDDFARAVFAYDEAVTLWTGNDHARRGRSEARREFAECALYKGDFDLGLSQTDPDDPEHVDVIVRLRDAQRERSVRDSRFRNMRRVAVLFAALILIGSVGVSIVIMGLWRKADDSARQAEREKEKAEDNEKTAKKNEKTANEATIAAKRSGREAVVARNAADEARRRAERDEDQAEQNRFFAEVGVVNERIEGNAFDVARQVLASHRGTRRARLRHWEWGRLDFLVNGGRAGDDVVRHGDVDFTIENLAISGDERTAVTVGNGGQVEVWSIADLRRTARWSAEHSITSVATNRDGSVIVTAGGGVEQGTSRGALRVWRKAADGYEAVAQAPSVPDRLLCVALSPDGRTVAAGGRRGSAWKWSWEAAGALVPLQGHFENVWGAAFSPDGGRVATAGEDGTVRIWDAASGRERQRYRGHAKSAVYCVTFSSDGRRVASGDYDGQVLVWPVDDSRELVQTLRDEVERARDREEAAPPQILRRFKGHAGSVRAVGFSRDDRRLASGAQDNTVKIWSLDEPSGGVEAPPTTLRGHGGWVRAVRLIGQGDALTVVSAAMDRAWRSWDVARYREEVSLAGSNSAVRRAIYAAGGRAIVVARDSGEVQVWSASDGRLARTLGEGHEFLVQNAFTSPDGERLYTVSLDGTLRAWDLRSGVQEAVLQGVGRRGLVAPSSDGRFALTGGPDKNVIWWDLASARPIHRLDPRAGSMAETGGRGAIRAVSHEKKIPEITALAVSRDGATLFAGDDAGMCRTWDARTGRLVAEWRGHEWGLTGAAFVPGSEGGERLLTSSTDQNLTAWQLAGDRPRVVASYRHLDPVWTFAVSPDGRQVVTSSNVADPATNKKVAGLWVWDLATTKPRTTLRIAERIVEAGRSGNVTVNTLAWSAAASDSIFLSTTDQKTSRQELWRWRPGPGKFETVKLPAGARGSFWTALPIADGTQLITAGGKGARLWDLVEGREKMSFAPLGVRALAASRDGRWVVVAGGEGQKGIAKIWALPDDLAEAAHRHTLIGDPLRPFTAAAFAPSSEELFTADASGEVRRWSVEDRRRDAEAPLARVDTAVHDLNVTPDGRRVVLACDDGIVRIVDVASGEVRKLSGHAGAVLCASVSRDGRWLLTGSEDRSAVVWSLTTERSIATLVGHSAAVNDATFSPDGLRAITGGRDSTAKLWNLFPIVRRKDADGSADGDDAEPQETLTLPPHRREISSVAFSPDGLDILTASADATVKIWMAEALPPAVELAPGGIAYPLGDPPAIVDDQALVSQPNPVRGERLTLALEIENAERGDELSVLSLAGSLEVREDAVYHVGGADATETPIATIERGDGARSLRIVFAPDVLPSLVQATLRRVAFRNARTDAAVLERRVTCRLESSERKVDQGTLEARTVRIELPESFAGNESETVERGE